MMLTPLSSEKAIRLLERENTLVFKVDDTLSKTEIKRLVEERFNVRVTRVNTMRGPQGRKAYVTLSRDASALDIASQLGLL